MSDRNKSEYTPGNGSGSGSVTPSSLEWETRDSGKTDVYGFKDGQGFDNSKSHGGQSPHSHGVRNSDGSVDYSRTIDGHVVHDSKKK